MGEYEIVIFELPKEKESEIKERIRKGYKFMCTEVCGLFFKQIPFGACGCFSNRYAKLEEIKFI